MQQRIWKGEVRRGGQKWSFPKGRCGAGAQQRKSSLFPHLSPPSASLFPSLSCPIKLISPAFQSSGLDPSSPSKPKVHQRISPPVGWALKSLLCGMPSLPPTSVWKIPTYLIIIIHASGHLQEALPDTFPHPPASAGFIVHPWLSQNAVLSLSLSSSCILYCFVPQILGPLEGFIFICFYLYTLPW